MTDTNLRWDFGDKDVARRLQGEDFARGESLWADAWQRLRRNRGALWSLRYLLVVVVLATLAPVLPLPSPMALDLQDEPQPPISPFTHWGDHGFTAEARGQFEDAWDPGGFDRALISLRVALFGDFQTGHWLGTDAKGRDLMARILWGSRVSLLVALSAGLCSLLIGVTYGAISGYLGGRVDNLMMRFVDVLYSVPFVFVVIFLVTVLAEFRVERPAADGTVQLLTLEEAYGIDKLLVFFVVIGAIFWLTMARVVRGQVLSLKHSEFIEAARVLGASTPRILFVHVVPNVLSVVIVYLTLTIPSIMLFEAFLSFLGLGVEPPRVSWGLLAVDTTEAINPVKTFWWLVAWPSLAIGSTLLALNLLGDGLRDALDPKMRGSE